jgi:low affinity Fe/Cu permease
MINQDLICLERWCNENGMVINTSKTKSMAIAGKRIRNNTNTSFISIDAKLNDVVIDQVLSYKLLGVSLDQDLSFTTQIDELCKKLSKRIGLLRHICPYLKQKQREIITLQ